MALWNETKKLYEFTQQIIQETPTENNHVSRFLDTKKFYSTSGLAYGETDTVSTTTTYTPIFFNESTDDALTFPNVFSKSFKYSLKYFVGISSDKDLSLNLCLMYYDENKAFISKTETREITSADKNINIEIIADNFTYPANTKYVFLGANNTGSEELQFYYNYATLSVSPCFEEKGANPKTNTNHLFVFVSGTGGGIAPNPIPEDLTIKDLILKVEEKGGIVYIPRLLFNDQNNNTFASIIASGGDINISGGNINVNENKIINLKAPTNDDDATTKKYVDDNIANFNGDLSGVESDISSLNSRVTTNEADITALETQQSTNTTNLNTVSSQTNTNTTNIGTLTSGLANKLSLTGGTMSGNLGMNASIHLNKGRLVSFGGEVGGRGENRIITIANNDFVMYKGNDRFFAINENENYTNQKLNMDGNKIINVGAGTNTSDAVNLGQLNTKLSLSGGTMAGHINMDKKTISDISSLGFTPTSVGGFSHINFTDAGGRGKLFLGGMCRFEISTADPDFTRMQLFEKLQMDDKIYFSSPHKIENMADGTNTNDAVNLGQLNTKLSLSGGTMTGDVNFGSNAIKFGSSFDSVFGGDSYTALRGGDGSKYLSINANHVHTNHPLEMEGNKITGVATPTENNDAVNKAYVDSAVNGGDAYFKTLLTYFNNTTADLVGTFPFTNIQVNDFGRGFNVEAFVSLKNTTADPQGDYPESMYLTAQFFNNTTPVGSLVTVSSVNAPAVILSGGLRSFTAFNFDVLNQPANSNICEIKMYVNSTGTFSKTGKAQVKLYDFDKTA